MIRIFIVSNMSGNLCLSTDSCDAGSQDVFLGSRPLLAVRVDAHCARSGAYGPLASLWPSPWIEIRCCVRVGILLLQLVVWIQLILELILIQWHGMLLCRSARLQATCLVPLRTAPGLFRFRLLPAWLVERLRTALRRNAAGQAPRRPTLSKTAFIALDGAGGAGLSGGTLPRGSLWACLPSASWQFFA